MFAFIDWIDVCFLDDPTLYRLSRKIRTMVEILDREHGPTGYRWLTTSVPLLLSVSYGPSGTLLLYWKVSFVLIADLVLPSTTTPFPPVTYEFLVD